MASLADALGESLTGQPHMSSWTFSDHLEVLVDAYGSGRAAARELGIAESTLRGWRHGRRPRDPGIQDWVVEQARETLVQQHGGWPTDYSGMTVTCTARYSTDERSRSMNIGSWVPESELRQALELWAAGDEDGAERVIEAAIDQYYAPITLVDVQSIRWV